MILKGCPVCFLDDFKKMISTGHGKPAQLTPLTRSDVGAMWPESPSDERPDATGGGR